MAGVRSQLTSRPTRSLYWSLAPCVVFFCMLEVEQWHKIACLRASELDYFTLTTTCLDSPVGIRWTMGQTLWPRKHLLKHNVIQGRITQTPSHETCRICNPDKLIQILPNSHTFQQIHEFNKNALKPQKWNMYNSCFNSGNTILVFMCESLCPFDVFWMSMYALGSLLVHPFPHCSGQVKSSEQK